MTGFFIKYCALLAVITFLSVIAGSFPCSASDILVSDVDDWIPEPLTEKIILPEEEDVSSEEEISSEENASEEKNVSKPEKGTPCGAKQTLLDKGETDDPFIGRFLAFEKIEEPTKAYDFSFAGKDGQDHKLSEYKGKYVFLHFWASWCRSCITELPSIISMKDTLRDDAHIVVLPISTDFKRPLLALENFLKRSNASELPLFYDRDKDIKENFEITGMPSSYILSPEGEIMYKMIGANDWTKEEALDFIKATISQ